MDCGDTFLMPAPGGVATPHLWIVVTQPDPQTHLCAIVSVTTLRNSKDQPVILRRGDHPFIRHDSTIFYGDAMIVDALRRFLETHRPELMERHVWEDVEWGLRGNE